VLPQALPPGAVDRMPSLVGDPIVAPRVDPTGTMVHASWCVAAGAADAAAGAIAATLARQGWAELATRGDASRAGVAGDRDGDRVSIVVAASTLASCPAPGHYLATATLSR